MFIFTFDRDIQSVWGTANLNARLRVLENNAEVLALPSNDSSFEVRGRQLVWGMPGSRTPAVVLQVKLDPGLVGEAMNRSGYFPGSAPLLYSTMGLPPDETNNFTMALNAPIEMFSLAKLCSALQEVLFSLECPMIDALLVDPAAPIVRFRLVNLAYNTSEALEMALRQAYSNGWLSSVFQARGMGAILPGSWTEQTDGIYEMPRLEVTYSPMKEGVPTVGKLMITLNSPLREGELLHVFLPPNMQLTGPLTVNIGNETWSSPVPPSNVRVGAPGTSLIVNTSSLWYFRDFFVDRSVTIWIQSGLSMPASCSSFGVGFISPYSVKRYTKSMPLELVDFIVADPKLDGCIGIKAAEGIALAEAATTANWFSYTPVMGIAGAQLQIEFLGFLFSAMSQTSSGVVFAKVAALPADRSCQGFAYNPGKEILIHPITKKIVVTIPKSGVYDVCIKIMTNWEIAAEQLIIGPAPDVEFIVKQGSPQPATMPGTPGMVTVSPGGVVRSIKSPPYTVTPAAPLYFGYNSCAASLKSNKNYCGCYLSAGKTTLMRNLNIQTAISKALVGRALAEYRGVVQGCCDSNPVITETSMLDFDGPLMGHRWGFCQ